MNELTLLLYRSLESGLLPSEVRCRNNTLVKATDSTFAPAHIITIVLYLPVYVLLHGIDTAWLTSHDMACAHPETA